MRITGVKTALLTGPCTNDPYLSESRKLRSAAFIEIHTDGRLVGIGETYAGYSIPEAVPEIVRFFAPILVGQDVEDVEDLWLRMYACGNYWCRVGLGAAVLTGIEAALWDLKGKMLGQPVYELLGGRRHDRLACYATGGPSNYPLDKLAAKVEHYLSGDFGGVKLAAGSFTNHSGLSVPNTPTAAADLEDAKLRFLRSRFGDDLKIMLDGHMNCMSPDMVWSLPTALAVMKACEPHDLFFFEEPLPYSDPGAYAALAHDTTVPIAGGECLTTSLEWRAFVEQDAFDIGQPDASFNGGLSETVKIARMLDARGRKIATHAWGAGASLMQNIHVAFACSNTAIVEIPPDYGPLHRELIGDGLVIKGGCILPPQRPGLGIELSDRLKSRYPFIPGSGEFVSVPGKILNDEALIHGQSSG
jgi:L-alanine-DL-glutamate epimerase-like enolase superfamily enzyme